MPATTIPPSVLNAIVEQTASALAKEQAAELVEKWIERFEAQDRTLDIVAVEQPWFEWINRNTLAVGCRDLVLSNGIGEWKTHREPRKKRDGSFWQGEGPKAWEQEMEKSIQLAMYGLGGVGDTTGTPFLVRAAIKTSPPDFWQAVIGVPRGRTEMARHSLAIQADMIRAARRHLPPWRFPDEHRFYNRPCICGVPNENPAVELINPHDPGAKSVINALTEHPERNTTDLVVLSASSYETSVDCLEAYRRTLTGQSEDSEALDIGSCCHAGWAAWYRYLKEEKDNARS